MRKTGIACGDNELKIALYALAASFLAGTALAGGYVTPVGLADVAPASAEADWTGFYTGLQYGQGELTASRGRAGADLGDIDAFGLHLGYLHDMGQLVLGGELDYNNVDLQNGAPGSSDMWRLRGRAGYDMGRFQPYLALGVARLSDSGESETGVTWGFGGDYLLNDSVSLGLEYSRSSFDKVAGTTLDLDADLLQIRASYRF